MQYNPRLYNVSMLPDSYYRYFEVGNGFFITNGGSPAYASTYDFKKYGNLLGGVADPTLAGNATSNSYLQGEILRTSFLNVLWSIYTIQLCLCDYFSDACNEIIGVFSSHCYISEQIESRNCAFDTISYTPERKIINANRIA